MLRPASPWCWLVIVIGMLSLMAAGGQAFDDTEVPKVEPKLRGVLPPNFRLLGLTEEQKQQIYKIQNDFNAKIAALEAQIKKLKAEERLAIEKVLTEAQRARLKEILREKTGLDTPGEQKPDSPGGKP
jgi:hypothetical protein